MSGLKYQFPYRVHEVANIESLDKDRVWPHLRATRSNKRGLSEDSSLTHAHWKTAQPANQCTAYNGHFSARRVIKLRFHDFSLRSGEMVWNETGMIKSRHRYGQKEGSILIADVRTDGYRITCTQLTWQDPLIPPGSYDEHSTCEPHLGFSPSHSPGSCHLSTSASSASCSFPPISALYTIPYSCLSFVFSHFFVACHFLSFFQ